MQSYVYWSIVTSTTCILGAVLAVGVHRANMTSFGGDPLGAIILFYAIAFLAWLNERAEKGTLPLISSFLSQQMERRL